VADDRQQQNALKIYRLTQQMCHTSDDVYIVSTITRACGEDVKLRIMTLSNSDDSSMASERATSRQTPLPSSLSHTTSPIPCVHPSNPQLSARHAQPSFTRSQPLSQLFFLHIFRPNPNFLFDRCRKLHDTAQQPRPPAIAVQTRPSPCVEPHTHHNACPYEVEDRHHEQEDVRKAPLIRLTRLTRTVVQHVSGVV